MTEMNIKTSFWRKPIPTDQFDWQAWDDDTYEGGAPIGHGPTEQAAIADLRDRLAEAATDHDRVVHGIDKRHWTETEVIGSDHPEELT